MDSTVTLQPDFHSNIKSVMILGILLIFWIAVRFIATFLARRLQEKKAAHKSNVQIQPVMKPADALKQKYLLQVSALEQKLLGYQITPRECFQSLSALFRDYVKEATGIDITTKTLQEIRDMKIPFAAALVGEYYIPEFGPEGIEMIENEWPDDANGEAELRPAQKAIQKTKKVIEEWN